MIGRPLPGPREAAPPEPPVYQPPRMTAWVPQAVPAVRRITEAGFDATAAWLVPRLIEDKSGADPDAVTAWLRQMMNDPAVFLMRTDDLVGLAEIRRTTLMPAGIVSEVFVRSREPNGEQAVLMYRAMRDWAALIGAAEFRFNIDSEVGIMHVAAALMDRERETTPKKRSVYVATLRR